MKINKYAIKSFCLEVIVPALVYAVSATLVVVGIVRMAKAAT